ncbi:WD40 repeat-like protein [Macrolepiota fuliginosa MF-IS2]|uniref:WD40 repeat-like protein n=1 Tax=Macrolepiota fuliginosa MF-IS2 TaxID=1400762 RepID=A0A9P6C3E5_9AGAR|nr:WD40 repeat-like protein [Macrolepiota fuliginosa MF-IS2]
MSGAMLPDFTEALQENGTHGRSRRHAQANNGGNRRETILSLVEMLLQSEEVTKRKEPTPSFEADRDVPSVDEHLQGAGADAFNKFSRRMSNFDRELRNFANAARQLGSSVAILSSVFHLRERLAQILFLYRENAAALFPRKVSRAPRDSVIDPQNNGRRRGRRWRPKAPSHIVRPIVNEDIDVEEFPDQMEYFAKDIGTFLHCLNEFPEFTDEAVNASILSFERDLQYWASCLREYTGQFRNPAVQRYLHDLSIEMGEHIDGITSTLSIFIEVGVPIIRFAQKHGATNLLNLSTVATFFSAVTATTMQFSYELHGSPLSDAVNSFWFASLVFSIAAAVNSLLGLTWKQAMYRSPGDRVPWWVLIWIKRSPLVFLVMSVACFSIGLCFFAYASNQAPLTSTITTVLTALTSFGLCAVSAWFATERWIFMRYRGKKWLDDVLMEITDTMLQNRVVDLCRQGSEKLGHGLVVAASAISPFFFAIQIRLCRLFCRCLCVRNNPDDHESVLPVSNYNSDNHSTGHHSKEESAHNVSAYSHRKSTDTVLALQTNLGPIPGSPRSPSIGSLEKSPTFESARGMPFPIHNTISPVKQRWRDTIRAVRMCAAISDPNAQPVVGTPRAPSRRRTTSSTLTDKKRANTPMRNTVAKSRVADLVPRLKALEASQDLAAHTALVKHLQFSPDGKYLATSSWDRTSVIFKVGDPFVSHRTLAHVKGFVGQVAWSPDGKYLLTKMSKGMKVWTAEDGVCKKTIEREEPVEAITWCYYDHKFMSVEGSKVYQLDITGKQFNVFDLGSIKIHDVAVTPDDRRALAVGPLLQSPTGLFPSKSRAEKRLIVFNMELHQIECQVPVLNDVRDITLVETKKNELVALISYENKAAPQLWKLEIVRDRESGRESSRLTLRHTYMPKSTVDFAGPSYFGGKNHELVLCAGKTGDIFIWDTESGALLHHIRAQAHAGDLTCIAWNHALTDSFMFASGSHDGTVRIWTKPPNSSNIVPDDYPMDDDLHYHEDTYFAYGEISRASSPHEDLGGFLDSRPESPDPEYTRGRTKSPRGISFVSSHSSDSSAMVKLR